MATSGSTRTTLISPFQYFADPTRARPIFNGFIFIGRVDGDPTNTADQIPVQVICECGGSPVNVTQPIRTGPGGLPIYNGSPAQIVVCRSNYSITLQDNNRVQVYHSPNVQSGFVNQPITHTTLAAAMADDNSSRQVIRLLERGGAEFRRVETQTEYNAFPGDEPFSKFQDSASNLFVINNEVIRAEHFGCIFDGVTDTTTNYLSALLVAAGKRLIHSSGTLVISQSFSIPDNTVLCGQGRYSTTMLKMFNGDMCDSYSQGSRIEHMTIDGNSSNYTGKGLLINQGSNRQSASDFRIYNFNNYCIEFTHINSGSQSSFEDGIISRSDGGTAENWSVFMAQSPIQLTAVPRKFDRIESEGTQFINFGSCNNVYATDCFTGGYGFIDDSRAVGVINGRVTGTIPLIINGHQNRFVGVALSPPVTIGQGADDNFVTSCVLNNGITDNSENSRNSITTRSTAYTPEWTATTTNPSIGNGTLRGLFSRNGDVVTTSIDFIVGSATTLGVGVWEFSVPVIPRPITGQTQVGISIITDGTTATVASCRLVAQSSAIRIQSGSIFVSNTQPHAWSENDTIRIQFTYMV